MIEKKKIVETSKHIRLWTKIYNILCRSCKYKVFAARKDFKNVGTEGVVDNMELTMNELCPICKERIDRIIENQK